jgi:hypothetical protein
VTRLERVFVVKIAVTAAAWAGPLLLTPARWLEAAGLPHEARPVARLLGWAYLALGVGYVLGLRELRAGGRATSAVAVGIVSNGGAAALLTWFGLTGAWAGWHPLVRIATWASAAVTLAIALGLYWFGVTQRERR